MLKKYSKVLLPLILILGHLPAEENRSRSEASDNFPWPSKLRIFTAGATEGRGILTVDYLMPLCYSHSRNNLFFFNPKERLAIPFSEETNLGLGFRTILKDKIIFGINYFHDIQCSTHHKWYNQNGGGFEILSKPFDLRFNYYHPSTHAKAIGKTSYEFGNTNLIAVQKMEIPLKGYDFEAGIPFFEKTLKTRVYLGGFFFHSNHSEELHGVRFRSETSFTDWIALDSMLDCPNHGKTNFILGLRFTIPLYLGKQKDRPKLTYIQDRIFERVVRDLDIQSSSYTQKTNDPNVRIIYVDNRSIAQSPDGTLNKPYPTLAAAFTSSRYLGNGGDANYIYLSEGDGTDTGYQGKYVLADGVTLWGSGYNGGYNGINATGYPTINAETHISGLEPGNNSTIMGIELKNSLINGINVSEKSNVSIHHNLITATEQFELSGGAISILNSEYEISNVYIYNNVCFSNSSTAGIFIENLSASQKAIRNVVIKNNVINNNFGGIVIRSFAKGNIENIAVSSNTINNNGIGIYFDINNFSTNSAIQNCSVCNNTVTSNIDGIALMCSSATGTINAIDIFNNNVTNNTDRGGILLIAGRGQIINIPISSNRILNNDAAGGINLSISDSGAITAKVYNNQIAGNLQNGINIEEDSVTTGYITADFGGGAYQSRGYNSIYQNSGYDFNNSTTSATVQAKYNWWNSAFGPSGDKIYGITTSEYTPWLQNPTGLKH